jgi:hypothetical protein
MTVLELIEALRQCDPDVEVLTEGCDCEGDVGAVVEQQEQEGTRRWVMLRRSHRW